MSEATTRVLVADDHPMCRTGLRAVLARAGIAVVGVVTSAELFEACERLAPDVVVLDVVRLAGSGVDLIRRLRQQQLQDGVELVVFSAHYAPALIDGALAAGAVGYVSKASEPEHVVRAIEKARSHQRYLCPIARGLVHRDGRARPALTPREREVAKLLAEGLSSKEIAFQLGISVRTVGSHRGAIMKKLAARNVTDVVRWAMEKGYLGSR